jgi:hypothetical protein
MKNKNATLPKFNRQSQKESKTIPRTHKYMIWLIVPIHVV